MAQKRKDPAAVSLGRRGGKIGGLAKVPKGLAMLTPERRKEIALLGAAARQAQRERVKRDAQAAEERG